MILSYREERHDYDHYPGTPPAGMMHVFIRDGEPEMVNFLCPCGCGSELPIHLQRVGKAGSPRHWQFSQGQNGPTLSPSVKLLSGCKAHFNITDGKTIIHPDSGT